MKTREPRIDIIRGFSILVILVNHLTEVVEFDGLRGWMIPTPTRYGYSTAAELFVIMSGYMVGMVYLSRAQPMLMVGRRAATLWTYNIALLATVLPLVAFMRPEEFEFWRLSSFVSTPTRALWSFLTLQSAPRLLDVLQTYVRLMLLSPIAILIHRQSPALVIPLSVGIYLIGQILSIIRLSAGPDISTDGLPDLLSWQMLFFVPMALGARKAHVPLFRWLDRNWAMLGLLLALFVAGAVARQLQSQDVLVQPTLLTDRYGLHVLRLAHAVLMLMLYASALTLAGRFIDRQPFRAIGAIGRHSLVCFSTGVVVTYGLGRMWERSGGDHLTYYLCETIGVILTVFVAHRLETRRNQRAVDNERGCKLAGLDRQTKCTGC